MNQRPKHILSGTGLFAVLLLCLVAVGVSSWVLLLRNSRGTPAAQEAGAAASIPAEQSSAPVSSAGAEEEYSEPEAAGHVVAPADIPQETVEMPEEAETPASAGAQIPAAAPDLIVSPLSGEVISAFSMDQLQYSRTLEDWRTHNGIDIAASAGTNVLAACAGTVLSVSDDAMMGTTVVLSHSGGYQTVYANLQAKPTVSKGDAVSAGQILGAVGTTSIAESAEGPHLHFSVTKDGDVVDPQKFLKR